MGPHLQMRWDTWGSSRVVAGNSAFISSCDGNLSTPLSCLRESSFLSSFEREPGIVLEVLQEKRASSRVDRGISWFVSSCGGRLGVPLHVPPGAQEPLVLPQGSQVSIHLLKVNARVFWSHGRGIRPQFAWKGESQGVSRVAAGSVGSLKLPQGPEGASHVVSGKSGILSSCEGPLGIPLKLVRVTRASSRVEAGNSGFLSSSDRDLGVPIEIPLGSQTSSHVRAWNSASLLRWKRGVRPPVELR